MWKKAVLFVLCVCLYGMCAHAEPSVNEKVYHIAPDTGKMLSRLEQKMSGIQTLQTNFVQEKKLAVFNQKIVLKGTMYLQKPTLFAWHVREPMRYSMIINGNMLCQWDEDTNMVQQISLAENPAFQVVIAQMKEWFSGKYTALLENYTITIPIKNPVTLEFIPRETTGIHSVINRVTIVFREDEQYIYQIYIEEKSGDSMLLTFVDTQLNDPINAAAWEVKPRVQ